MGWNDVLKLRDSGGGPPPGSALSSVTLVYVVLGPGSSTAYLPHLGGYPTPESIHPEAWELFTRYDGRSLLLGGEYRPFELWWNMLLFQEHGGDIHSRTCLLLMTSTQAGGAQEIGRAS